MLELIANLCPNPNCACITSDCHSYCGDACRKQDDLDDAVDYCHCGHGYCVELTEQAGEDEVFNPELHIPASC